jgi:predicted RNase H-like nuclease (RuvC/YqgF family)
MKPVIVGIDFGITSSVAVFDMNNNLLLTKTKRNFSIPAMKREILKTGKPLIIATDRKKPSPKIEKIAASFNCKVFSPRKNLTVKQKTYIVKDFKIKKIHERDAIAAARFAFKSHAHQFDNIDKTLYSLDLEKKSDKVKEMILTKKAQNISDAVDKLGIDWKKEADKLKRLYREKQKSYEILKTYTDKIEEKIHNLRKQKKTLLEEQINKTEETRKKVLSEREIQERDILIKQLQFELTRQRNIIKAYEELE